MKASRPSIAVLLGAFCTLSIFLRSSRADEPPSALAKPLYDLHEAAKKANLTPAANAQSFIDWMTANDWRSLNLSELYNLYGFINIDSVDRRHVSARWTGTLTAPSTGTYTLRQVRQYSGADSRVKLVINGQTVLDSTDPRSGDKRFVSQPVEFTQSQPVPIQVEMTHDVTQIEVSEGAPMVVLTWKVGDAKDVIVPSSAFTPPEGFGEAGAHGLKGEYFADVSFQDLKSTRLDSALDIVATWPPLAPVHQAEASAVFDACKSKLMDDAFLTQAAANGGPDLVFRRTLWRAAYRMRAIERQQLAQKLLNHPEVLKGMTPGAMARLMQAFFMLPGKEHLTLIGEWALARSQQRFQVLDSPVVSTGTYENTDYDSYWRLGHVLQGPYWGDVATLWTKYLVRPNGECNLAVAYMTAYSTREEASRRDGRFVHTFTDRIQQGLDDKTITGDKRVTWLFARTFADEVLYSGLPLVSPNSQFLTEARLVAETPDYTFWTLQEIAARQASLGAVDSLTKTVGDYTGSTPEEQAAITAWRDKAAKIAADNTKLRADAQAKSDMALVTDLQRRLAVAQTHQNQAEINRCQQLLNSMQPQQSNQ
jgi:hypothetical protein